MPEERNIHEDALRIVCATLQNRNTCYSPDVHDPRFIPSLAKDAWALAEALNEEARAADQRVLERLRRSTGG